MLEELRFLSEESCRELAQRYGTPLYVYSQPLFEQRCREALAFPNHFGVTVRYALKANPNRTVLKIVDSMGLHFDASSEFEVKRCLDAGIAPEKIQLTSQQMASQYIDLIKEQGVHFNACSLHQLETWGKKFPGSSLSIRINPGLGSGANRKTDVGGPTSSFGIWHEDIDQASAIIEKYDLNLNRLHSHIGSGTDPEVWKGVAQLTLDYAEQFKSVETVNLGGGFKVARMKGDKETILAECGASVAEAFADFAERTGRKLHLEIEPGTYIAANAGCIISEIDDITTTGKDGYEFLKVNTGMDAVTRPALYGAAHPMVVVPREETTQQKAAKDYVVTGHCCESGDLFTVTEDDLLEPRLLAGAEQGDYVVVEGAGAYCGGMSLKGYNSFPGLAEVLLDNSGQSYLIKEAQKLEELYDKEILPDFLK